MSTSSLMAPKYKTDLLICWNLVDSLARLVPVFLWLHQLWQKVFLVLARLSVNYEGTARLSRSPRGRGGWRWGASRCRSRRQPENLSEPARPMLSDNSSRGSTSWKGSDENRSRSIWLNYKMIFSNSYGNIWQSEVDQMTNWKTVGWPPCSLW